MRGRQRVSQVHAQQSIYMTIQSQAIELVQMYKTQQCFILFCLCWLRKFEQIIKHNKHAKRAKWQRCKEARNSEDITLILSMFACTFLIYACHITQICTFSSESPGWQVTTLSPGHLGNVSLQFLSHYRKTCKLMKVGRSKNSEKEEGLWIFCKFESERKT